MKISDFILRRREMLQMTQMDVANALTDLGHPISPAGVGHWESGRNSPPLRKADFRTALATILQIDVNEMMEILGYTTKDDDRPPEALMAADIIAQLPPDKRAEVLARLRFELQLYQQTLAPTG